MNENIIECVTTQSVDWSNIVMAIASVLNLIIIIKIFFSERSTNKKKEEKIQKKSWYGLFGIENLTIQLSKEINFLKEKTADFYSGKLTQEDYKTNFKEVENKLLEYKNEFLTIVDCINPEMVNSLTDEFGVIQDLLYDLLVKCIGDKNTDNKISSQERIIYIDKVRKRIIKMSVKII